MDNKTFKILIISAAIATLLWTSYFLGLSYIKKSNSSLVDLNSQIIITAKKEEALKKLREKVISGSQGNIDLDSFIIRGEDVAELVQTLENFGPKTKTEVLVNSVNTEASANLPAGSEFLRLNVAVNGAASGVLNCLRLIESLPYNMKITDFSLSKAGTAASSTNAWQVKIDMRLVKMSEVERVN